MESQSQHADEAALVDDILQAQLKQDRKEGLRRRRYRMKIVALRRCGYLGADEETRAWS